MLLLEFYTRKAECEYQINKQNIESSRYATDLLLLLF